MKILKILNLFSGFGGNRKLWNYPNCLITAVEIEPKIAQQYHKRFPNDIIIIEDAYEYLENHFHEFDIIWSSNSCVSHTKMMRFNASRQYNIKKTGTKLPDLRLYSTIIFLNNFFRGNWVVENVIPYYEPLIKPTFQIGRHYYWSNVIIPSKERTKTEIGDMFHGQSNPTRNLIDPHEGKLIMDYLIGKYKQTTLENFS